MSIVLEKTKRTDPRLLARMKVHYSQPKGFVGRNICYAVSFKGDYYGHIVGGSATRYLPGRDSFCPDLSLLNNGVNNVFYNVSSNNKYPLRNFTSRVVLEYLERIEVDWYCKYGDLVYWHETLVQKPRTGDLYLKAGFKVYGETKGYSCKREGGTGTDSWSGRRVWDVSDPKPKLCLYRRSLSFPGPSPVGSPMGVQGCQLPKGDPKT